ncbi:TRAP transporter small permease [Humidisolicoccus flavus]|uniref:TRAP transporter small permease n=1 Tax=Humidisolicoccus flavus TaxID=3111414 RepID=UPI00324DF7D2
MFDKILTSVENAIITIAFSAITLLTFVNVVSRYVFRGSLSFTVEIVISLAVLLTMVGASAAVRLGSHPGFEVLRTYAKGHLRTIVIVLITLATLAFYFVFMWLGLDMVQKQAASGRSTAALGIPQWFLSLALPLGALMGAVRAVQVCILQIMKKPEAVEQPAGLEA